MAVALFASGCATVVDEDGGGEGSGAPTTVEGPCGRACVGPGCAPTELATLGPAAAALAQDDAYLYTFEWKLSRIVRVSKCGGAVEVVAPATFVYAIAVDEEYVYWGESETFGAGGVHAGVLARAPKGGGAVEAVVDGISGASAIQVARGWVYWGWNEELWGAPLEGGAAVRLAASLSGARFAFDGESFYVSMRQHIGRVPSGGGDLEIVADTGLPAVDAVVVDETHVYWPTWEGEGALERAPKAGGASTALARGLHFPGSLVKLGSVLYTAEDDFFYGAISSVPATGGDVTKLSVGDELPAFLIADESYLYWIDSGSYQLLRLAHR